MGDIKLRPVVHWTLAAGWGDSSSFRGQRLLRTVRATQTDTIYFHLTSPPSLFSSLKSRILHITMHSAIRSMRTATRGAVAQSVSCPHTLFLVVRKEGRMGGREKSDKIGRGLGD